MKLAKQFDFNMHQQDREQVREANEGTTEPDADDLREPDGLGNNPPPSLGEVAATTGGPASQTRNPCQPPTEDRKSSDQGMADDFDALFDGPTQRISGRLSQLSSGPSQEGRPPSVAAPSDDALFGNGIVSGPGNPPSVSSASAKKPEGGSRTPASSRFVDDDWDDDDLLNDSIVLEMTQNPDLFATPKHCSTQIGRSPKQNASIQRPGAGNGAPLQNPKGNGGQAFDGLHQGIKSKTRSTFKLETNPNFHVKETLSGQGPNSSRGVESSSKPGHSGGLQSRPNGLFQPHKPAPLEPPNRNNLKTQTVPGGGRASSVQKPVAQQSLMTASASCVARLGQVGGRVSRVHGTESAESGAERGGKRGESAEPVSDAMDEDLDSIFASDSLWDDGDDDDLLCQVCEDVEKLSESQTPGAGAAVLDRPGVAPIGPNATTSSLAVKGTVAQNVFAGNQGQTTGPPQGAFSRSISVPGSTAAFAKTVPGAITAGSAAGPHVRNGGVSTATRAQSSASFPPAGSGPYRFTQLKTTTTTVSSAAANSEASAGPRYAENLASSDGNPVGSRLSSFKRHLSDPVALTNKGELCVPAFLSCPVPRIGLHCPVFHAFTRNPVCFSFVHGAHC